jgi:hypothetical protein
MVQGPLVLGHCVGSLLQLLTPRLPQHLWLGSARLVVYMCPSWICLRFAPTPDQLRPLLHFINVFFIIASLCDGVWHFGAAKALSYEWALRGFSAVRVAHRKNGKAPKSGPQPLCGRSLTWHPFSHEPQSFDFKL